MNKIKDLIEALSTGWNGRVLLLIVLLLLFVYLPYMLIYLRRRRKKQESFERAHKDAVKLYFELDFVGTLTVYSINGKEPAHFYETTRQGVYLLPGESILGVQYHKAKMSPLSVTGYKNFNAEPREIAIYAEKGKIYSLKYDMDEDEYEFYEIKKPL